MREYFLLDPGGKAGPKRLQRGGPEEGEALGSVEEAAGGLPSTRWQELPSVLRPPLERGLWSAHSSARNVLLLKTLL